MLREVVAQPAITCSKLTIGTLEQGVKYVQSLQWSANLLKRRLLHLMFSCEIYKIFKDTFFYRTTPLAAASGLPFTFLVIVDCQSKALKFDWQSLFRVW